MLTPSNPEILAKIQNPISSQTEFLAIAPELASAGYTHVPLVRETLADLDTPVSTYLKLADQPYTYLFESVQGGDKWGRYSIIGLPCDTVYRISNNQLRTEHNGRETSCDHVEDPLQSIRELQSNYSVACHAGLPDMLGGLVGYFGYETVAYIEPRLAQQFSDNVQDNVLGEPDIMLMVSTNVVVFDNLAGRIYIVTLADIQGANTAELSLAYQTAQQQLDSCITGLASHFTPPAPSHCSQSASEGGYQSHFEQEDFENAVETCREYIRAGDIMQVVLSQRLSTPFSGASLDVYRALRTINPSPYMYFLNMGDFDIVGSSPEILVRLQEQTVTVRPIAGTRKRGATDEQDLALEQELLNDEKELAEHLMLIDLGRNDAGRVAQIGSVELTEKMQVERYSHVMHIVSNVEATIKPELDAIDVLKATFPAGTVSGAPKIRAMEIIHELEPVKRGIYSGAVGYLGWNGNMDTAIAIRTAVIKDGTLNIQAGAGIVVDSVPKYEWKETLNKARVIFKAVEMASAGLQTTDHQNSQRVERNPQQSPKRNPQQSKGETKC